jgi:hypothetical protein
MIVDRREYVTSGQLTNLIGSKLHLPAYYISFIFLSFSWIGFSCFYISARSVENDFATKYYCPFTFGQNKCRFMTCSTCFIETETTDATTGGVLLAINEEKNVRSDVAFLIRKE